MPNVWTEIGNIMGPPGTAGELLQSGIVGEVPTGFINGTNRNFTTANSYITGTLAVYLNGNRTKDFTETGANTFAFNNAPLTGDVVHVDYSATIPPTTPVYISPLARYVALTNGVRLEVKNTSGVWIPQEVYTEA
jgi:hypothetical protein